MHNTGTVGAGDEVSSNDLEAALIPALEEVVEEGLVLEAHESLAFKLLENLIVLTFGVEFDDSCFCKNIFCAAGFVFEFDVVQLWMDGQAQVGGQGPGGRRPGHESRFWVCEKREVDDDCGVKDFFVVLLGFEVGEDGAAAVRVGHNAAAAVDETFLPQLLEDPPNAFHERGIEGFVVIIEVDPAANASDDSAPRLGVLLDDGAAMLIVLSDAHLDG